MGSSLVKSCILGVFSVTSILWGSNEACIFLMLPFCASFCLSAFSDLFCIAL